jgi:hypothetical protein
VTEGSASTIWRWLHEAAIKPWQTRSWIIARDPLFAPNAGRVLDLYAQVFEGRRLRPDEYVICADEKSQLQALGRPRSSLSTCAAARWPYLAAWDVHHANLFDRVEKTTAIAPFGRLVELTMTTEHSSACQAS